MEKDPGAKDRARKLKDLRIRFKAVQDNWTEARLQYDFKKCGSGSLEGDLEERFPPMSISKG